LSATSRMNLWGGEANVWRNVYYNGPYTTYGLNVLAGYRYLDLNPSIEIDRVSVYNADLSAFPAFQAAGLAGNRIHEHELVATRNQFNGGQLGVNSRFFLNVLILDATFKLALGSNSQEVHIDGNQVRTLASGVTVNSPGALLALPSNIGRFSRNKFS